MNITRDPASYCHAIAARTVCKALVIRPYSMPVSSAASPSENGYSPHRLTWVPVNRLNASTFSSNDRARNAACRHNR